MKTRVIAFSLLLLCFASSAFAVDLGTLFGSPKPTPVPLIDCIVRATKYKLVANGVDSTRVDAIDGSGAAITSIDVDVTSASGSKSYTAVALPKTVTASVPGQWDFHFSKAGYSCNYGFSIVAQ